MGKRGLVAKLPDPLDPDRGHASAELSLSASAHGAAVAHEDTKAPSGKLDLRTTRSM